MKTERELLLHIACALFLAAAYALPAGAQDNPCLACHAALAGKKEVHAAVRMGCQTCHSEIDTSAVPHKSTGKIAKGLSAEAPALCANCHDKKLFEGKVTHGPVAAGMCVGCHDPHASDYIGLLKKAPAALCLDCHPEVKQGPHVIAGFSRSGHPLGEPFKGKEAEDPLRPGKKFYCASCHEPHRSELPKLSRFGKGMASCGKCHNI
jgi:predicted CXXCH cytochrome family protein